jgi:aldehyde dehydrogenase (NAD+)
MPDIAEIFQSLEYGPAPEAASLVNDWLEAHGRTFDHFIDGRFVAPIEGERFPTMNPAKGTELAALAQGSAADVDAAVAAARRGFELWSALSDHTRARYLYAIARTIQKRSRFLAVLESMDNGKPIRETRDLDIPLVARHFAHHAGWAQLRSREFPESRPVGVCGQIIPWNFPLLMLAWKIAPALAAGNTVVLKPAEYTSLTALAFAEICRDVGLPPGVVNIVTGDGRTGAALVEHPDVDKIAFTGSTEVGRLIRAATAGSGKKLTLELGGKSPFIVFDDADLDGAVEGVVDAIWFNQGQVCCAGSRLLVQEGVADRFLGKLKARMETLRVGDPLDKAVDIGAIVAAVQLERIEELVATGKLEGGEIWQPSGACPAEGWYYPPTLFTNITPASTLAQVEIFGPVLVAMTFRTPTEAVELANNTRYGLAASLWSENLNLALDIAPKLACGVVWVNSTNLFDAAAAFGGYRESGYGREGAREGMREYLVGTWRDAKAPKPEPLAKAKSASAAPALPAIDRTPKVYIGGKQARPDSGYSIEVRAADGQLLGEVPRGNRKDLRNAVEAAHKASGWTRTTGSLRSQILFFLAENLAAREAELTLRIAAMTGRTTDSAAKEVQASVERLFHWGAMADKYDGAVHHAPVRNVTLAMPEALGVVGVVCPDEAPLLGLVSLLGPLLATGNRVVVVPSERHPLAATDLYQILDTSDVPGGVVNIVTGLRSELATTLAEHDDIAAVWYAGPADGAAQIERASVGNLKQTFVLPAPLDWLDPETGANRELLDRATQIKTIWVPYGE